MKGKTHFFAGLFLATLLLTVFSLPPKQEFLLLIATIFAAILPDIDLLTSGFAPKNTPLLGWLLKHRGVWHSIYFLVLITSLALLLFNWYIALGVFLGYLSHLLLDSLSYAGIDYFGTGKKLKGKVRYDTPLAYLIDFLLLMLTILMLSKPFISLIS